MREGWRGAKRPYGVRLGGVAIDRVTPASPPTVKVVVDVRPERRKGAGQA